MSMGSRMQALATSGEIEATMPQFAEDIRRMTIAEFDEFVAGLADDREYELIDGELAMMVNPTETHEQIAANIGAPLKLATDRRGCRTYQGGMRVQLDDDSSARDKYRPDVLVRCGPRQNETYVTDPVVIVEVLSPSHYRQRPRRQAALLQEHADRAAYRAHLFGSDARGALCVDVRRLEAKRSHLAGACAHARRRRI